MSQVVTIKNDYRHCNAVSEVGLSVINSLLEGDSFMALKGKDQNSQNTSIVEQTYSHISEVIMKV